MEEDETENLVIETIEIAGEIVNEPVLNKTIRELTSGERMKHRKVTLGPFFCRCGKRINKDNALRCSTCGKLECQDCGFTYTYHNEVHCRECLRKDHDIFIESKTEYIVLYCISKGITGKRTIFEFTGIPPNAVEGAIEKFLDRYVTTKKASFVERFFPKLRVTNLGCDALGVFERVYGEDPDFLNLKERISESEKERTKRNYHIRME